MADSPRTILRPSIVMKFPVQLMFSDGRSRTLQVEEGEGILAASRDDGLALLVDCEEGICGTCQARLTSGCVSMDPYSEGVLSDSEVQDGLVLVCRARANANAVIELPYSSSDASMRQDDTPSLATVVGVETVSSDTVSLILETGEALAFLPGQYVNISPNSGYERSFSMANAPGSTTLRFFIALRADGKFSAWLRQAEVGSQVQLSSARGSFFLRDAARPKIMIAGGTGLAPFFAMLAAIAEGSDAERQAPIQLLVGARSEAHLFGLDALEQYRPRLPGLQIKVACDEVAEGSHVRRGRVTEVIEELEMDRLATFYACGPPPMIDAVRQALMRRKVPLKQLHAEKFTG